MPNTKLFTATDSFYDSNITPKSVGKGESFRAVDIVGKALVKAGLAKEADETDDAREAPAEKAQTIRETAVKPTPANKMRQDAENKALQDKA